MPGLAGVVAAGAIAPHDSEGGEPAYRRKLLGSDGDKADAPRTKPDSGGPSRLGPLDMPVCAIL